MWIVELTVGTIEYTYAYDEASESYNLIYIMCREPVVPSFTYNRLSLVQTELMKVLIGSRAATAD